MSSFDTQDYIDSLTGLPNFAHFISLAQQVLNDPNERKDIVVIYFNIENFKSYNEKYGLAAGDDCLRLFGRTLEALFPQEIIARLSADHFGVVCDKADIELKITEACEEMRPFRMDTHMQVHAGIYFPTDDDFDINICVDRAKIACDNLQHQYDAMFGYYREELDEKYQREHFIIEQLESAIENGYIKPYYQAVVRALTGEISGFEALARWEDPTLGMISPADFVPILEKYQVVSKLDLAILECVCKDHQLVLERGGTLMPTSVNLSQQDFLVDDIVESVDSITRRYNHPRELIHIEITESIFGMNPEKVGEYIDRFRELGYEVWMDDFGSGYSSLNTLKDYHFDCLKLDMKFMTGFEDNYETRVILQTIINMAKKLRIQTVAEGVETREAADFMRKLGCENIQGYLYSRPVCLEESLELNLKRESESMRKYYGEIGKINLMSQDPLEYRQSSLAATSGLPMAVVELRRNYLTYLNANPAYIEYIQSIGLASLKDAEDFMNEGNGKLPSVFLNTIARARASKRMESADFVRNGQNCTFQATYITGYRTRSSYLITSMNMSYYTHVQRSERQAAITNFIFTQYNRIDLIDYDNHVCENLFTNALEFKVSKQSNDSREVRDQFCEDNILDIDQARFMAFFNLSDIEERIARTSKDFVQEYFRTRMYDGSVEWQEYNIIRVEVNNRILYLACISDLNIDRIRMLQGMDNKFRDIPRNPIFMWLSGRALATILGYKSYSEFLNNSYYFEVNLTQNYINEMHMGQSGLLMGKSYVSLANDYDRFIEDIIDRSMDPSDMATARDFFDRKKLIREFEQNNEIGSLEFRSYMSGTPAWFHTVYQMMRVEETGEILVYFLSYNVDDYNKRIRKERKAAQTDGLTGLYNRYGAVPMIRDYLHNHGDIPCALVMCDLDDFKTVNDRYGHICGDDMLRAFAKKLETFFEPYGIIGRIGGDEFIVLIKDRTRPFVQDLIDNFQEKPIEIRYDDQLVTCTSSVGYVMFPEQGTGYHDLYRKADSAMYHAKLSGKNCYSQYNEENDTNQSGQNSLRQDYVTEELPGGYLVARMSEQSEILLVNSYLVEMLGYDNIGELLAACGNDAMNLVDHEDQSYLLNCIYEQTGSDSKSMNHLLIHMRMKNGRTIKTNVFIRIVSNRNGSKVHLFITEKDQ